MNKFFQGVFYPNALKEAYISAGTWPENAVDVSDEKMSVYSQYPPEGKCSEQIIRGIRYGLILPPCLLNNWPHKLSKYDENYVLGQTLKSIGDRML